MTFKNLKLIDDYNFPLQKLTIIIEITIGLIIYKEKLVII